MDVKRFLDLQYERRPAALALQRMLKRELAHDAWREAVRARLKECLGAFPDALPPLNVRVLETIDMPGVDMTRIEYTSEDGLVTPAYCLKPQNATGKLPAVVAVTGHGYGHRDCVGLKPDGSIDPVGDYTHKFALRLCERGFAVIAPEPLGFGDLRLEEQKAVDPGISSCERINGFLTMMGRSLGGVRVLQAMRAIDVLLEIGDADRNRIGIMGISGGGLVTEFTAALDDRIRACVVSGYANTFYDSVMAMHHCVDNFFLGLARDVEMPDILASIAPRPMLWEAGSEDPIFPMFAVQKAYAQVKSVYEMLGAPKRLELDAFEGDHQISGARAYDFLWEHLS